MPPASLIMPSVIIASFVFLTFLTYGNAIFNSFVYDWSKELKEVDELIWFADKVHSSLKNSRVFFDIGDGRFSIDRIEDMYSENKRSKFFLLDGSIFHLHPLH